MNFTVDFQPYKDLLEEYRLCFNNASDANLGWSLNVRAEALGDYYEEKLAEFENIVRESETLLKQTEARLSLTLSPKSVADGVRQAMIDSDVIGIKSTIDTGKYYTQRLESVCNRLKNIRFSGLEAYKNGNRSYRAGSLAV